MYKIKTYIPTLSSYCYINEITNKNYIDINKYISANDNEGLSLFFESLLDESVKNTFDKLFVLIYLRMLAVGNELKLKYTEGSDFTASLSVMLDSLLKRLLEKPEANICDYVKDDLIIKFKEPTKLYYKNIIELYIDIIKDISIPNNIRDYKTLKPEFKRNIIGRLKDEYINDVKIHLNTNSSQYALTKVEDKDIFHINIYNSSPIKLLKLIYKNNISSLYLKLYHSIQKVNLTYSDFCSMTPAEVDLLLTIYKSANNIK